MFIKSLAIGSLMAFGLGAPVMAQVNQTVTGIQQSDQYQYAEGDGDILQNSTNIQTLDQQTGYRGRRGRRETVQQTVTGVQTNVQTQEGVGYGADSNILQNSVNINELNQGAGVRRARRR
ncbi:MAG: hypothetical protein AB4040_18375 [Synechococcus sp.]